MESNFSEEMRDTASLVDSAHQCVYVCVCVYACVFECVSILMQKYFQLDWA